MTTRYLLTGLLALLVTCGLRAEVTAPPIPADTLLIARMDVAAVRESKLGTALLDKHAVKVTNFTQMMNDYVGVDIDAIKGFWMIAPRKDDGVMVFQGSFDKKAITSRFGYLPNVVLVERAGTIFSAQFVDDKEPDVEKLAVLLNPSTLVIGKIAEVDAYLEAANDPKKLLKATDANVQRVTSSTHSVTATMFGDLTKWGDFDANMATITKHLLVTADVDADVEAALALKASTPAQAEAMGTLAMGFIKLSATLPKFKHKPVLQQAMANAKVSYEGSTATVTSKVNGADLMKSLPFNQ